MFGCITQRVRCAPASQFWIVDEFHDRIRQRSTVTRFEEQTVVAMLNNLWYVAHFCGNQRTAARESFAQYNRRRFGVQRSDHYHVARRVNVRRVPAISSHNNLVRQSGLVYRVPDVDAALQNPRSLANDDEARIGTLFQDEASCFNENELAFIWSNHTDVPNERRV